MLSGHTQARRTPELRLDVGKDVALAWRYQDVPHAQLPLRACQEAPSSFGTTVQPIGLHMRSYCRQGASLGCVVVVRNGGLRASVDSSMSAAAAQAGRVEWLQVPRGQDLLPDAWKRRAMPTQAAQQARRHFRDKLSRMVLYDGAANRAACQARSRPEACDSIVQVNDLRSFSRTRSFYRKQEKC